MRKRVLITGAGGFVGHHLLEHVLAATDWDVLATDSFRHKGRCDRIGQVLEPRPEWRSRVTVVTHDLCAPFTPAQAQGFGQVDYVVAMASESHVDRSLADPVPFAVNNVQVILNTLELARTLRPSAVLVVSTDEVYGPVEPGHAHPEWSPVIPSNPYAASKAAQEALAISYWRAYGVPVVITNIMNMAGERQDPEKYIPKAIRAAASGETLTIHGTPGNIGTRHYLHARNTADAWLHILTELPPAMFPDADRPDRYNIAGPEPISNLDLAEQIADTVGRPLRYELVDFHSARPGHDPHYGLDPSKLAAAGWKPPVSFAESLERTVRWSLAHPEWLPMSSLVFFSDPASEIATLTNTWTVAGVPTDPSVVTAVITDPTGTAVTHTVGAGPSPADITKTGTGAYQLLVPATLDGIWLYKWIGTGAAADVAEGTFTATTIDGRLYATVEELKSRLGITDTQDDFELTLAVQAASSRVDEICGRYFWRGTDTRTYVPESYYRQSIDDLVSVTTLKADRDGDGVYEETWVLGTDYQLEVAPGRYNTASKGELWPYTGFNIVGPKFVPVVWPWSHLDRLQLSGVFGWPAVPRNVKQAALLLAADYFKQKDAPAGFASGLGEYGSDVTAMLRRYMSGDRMGV